MDLHMYLHYASFFYKYLRFGVSKRLSMADTSIVSSVMSMGDSVSNTGHKNSWSFRFIITVSQFGIY